MAELTQELKKKIVAKKKKLNEIFLERSKKSDCGFYNGWKKFIVYKSGTVFIRCQAIMPNNSDEPQQCPRQAVSGHILCKRHGGVAAQKTKERAVKKFKDKGIYGIVEKSVLAKELKEIEEIDPEELGKVDDEIKLAVASLRAYLKDTPDQIITKQTGKLLFYLEKIVNFKKMKHEMTHAPNVSFTINQVNFVFSEVRSIIIEEVEDVEKIKKISDKFKKISERLKEEGF
jgi:hypothetical protein